VSWTLQFDYPRPPLSLNYRLHRMEEARLTKQVRSATCLLARNARIPELGRCRVTLTWFVTTRGRRDDENPVSTLKAMCDGLVDAGLVADDTHEFMEKIMPIIRYEKGGQPHMELLVEVLE
jgi:hypothetical protein